jgi:predicted acyltransferase
MTEQKRLLSLDVFRGMTIAGMVLVNNPGNGEFVYSQLDHAEWNGWTPTDMIFPFFVFIVGVSISIALGRRVAEGGIDGKVYSKIFKRTLIIFGLGLLIAAFPNAIKKMDFTHLRIMGVLQRLALCYFFASLIFLHTKWKEQAYIAAILLLGYWVLMLYGGNGDFTKEGNFAGLIDRFILTENHIWASSKIFDPEGILSTMPAIATCLSGVLCGTWLKTNRTDMEKVAGMFIFGGILISVGWIWNFSFPINKSLWTSSYVCFMSGQALCILAVCYWLIDIKNYTKWTKPFVIFGVNALALFVGSAMLARIMIYILTWTGADGKTMHLQKWIYTTIFAPFASPVNASLMYALAYIGFWLFLMWLLYRKRIYIKV